MANLSSARRSARSSAINQLDSLGSARSNFDTADTFSALENNAADFIARVKENIQKTDIVVSGAIENITLQVNNESINILGTPHLLYQDKGVKGSISSALAPDSPFAYTDKMPPSDIFVDYIKRKNIQLRNEESLGGKPSPHEDLDGDENAIQSAAYGMAKKVFEEGFKPQPIFSKEIPQLIEDCKTTLGELAANFITSSIPNYNRT